MQPNDFRYTIVIDGQEYQLTHAPIGWEETFLEWKRSLQYWGLTRTFSVPLRFVREGAGLLRRKFYDSGVNGIARLRIEVLNRATWTYRQLYLGEVDFSNCTDRRDEFEVTLMDNSIEATVKAYESVKYDIPISPIDAVRVRLPGIGLVDRAEAVIVDQSLPGIGNFQFNLLPAVNLTINNLDNELITAQSTQQELNAELVLSDNWFIRGEAPTNVTVSGNIKGTVTKNNPNATAQIDIARIGGRGPTNVGVVQTFVGSGTIPFDVDFQINFDVRENERFFFRCLKPSNEFNMNFFIEEATINISNALVTDESIVLGYRPLQLFQKLMNRMNNNVPVKVRSELLSWEWENLIITSGDAIRGIEGAKIQTSFQEFFKSMDAVMSCGFGVEGDTAVIEEKTYWNRDARVFDLGEIKDFNMEPLTEVMGSSIKAGYGFYDYEEQSGREEFNQGQIWSTPLRRVSNQIDLSSVYRADQFGIEDLRLTPLDDNLNEKDKESDNDTFMVYCIGEDGEGILDVESEVDYDSVGGVSARNAIYNLRISPKKNLLRHNRWLRSLLYPIEDRNLIFESSDKNSELVTVRGSERVKEGESIQISSLPTPIFLPFMATITTKVRKDGYLALDQLNTGYISFEHKGGRYEGYCFEVSQDIARNTERTYKLIIKSMPDQKNINYPALRERDFLADVDGMPILTVDGLFIDVE